MSSIVIQCLDAVISRMHICIFICADTVDFKNDLFIPL